MTTGAIIFAHNNTGVDYIILANYAAGRIKKFLDIPVTLVTDKKQSMVAYKGHNFSKVIKIELELVDNKRMFHDGVLFTEKLKWKNLTRSQVYDLTPYDRTLVIDSDYIINSSVLKPALTRDAEFQIYKNSIDLAEWRNNDCFIRVNAYSIPFYWATVFIFEKTPATKALFDLVTYIKDNWSYFKILYNLESTLYRNDYAFSIAIHILNGKTNGTFTTELPGNMVYSLDTDVLVANNETDMQFLLSKKNDIGQYILAKTSGVDIHVMNKYSLSRAIQGEVSV